MRVYLPVTTPALAELVATGVLGPAPLTAFAVTPALREWYRDEDPEALEYAATTEAARGSLRLLDADPSAARRRVVIARVDGRRPPQKGQTIHLKPRAGHLHMFNAESGLRMGN